IGRFAFGHAVVEGSNGIRVTAANGQLAAIPQAAAAAVVSARLVRFRSQTGSDAPWGLYDFSTGQVVAAPVFATIGHFVGAGAVASTADGSVGVIDKTGQWLLPPEYTKIKSLNGAVWQVTKPDDGKTMQAIVGSDGRLLLQAASLHTEVGDDGRV